MRTQHGCFLLGPTRQEGVPLTKVPMPTPRGIVDRHALLTAGLELGLPPHRAEKTQVQRASNSWYLQSPKGEPPSTLPAGPGQGGELPGHPAPFCHHIWEMGAVTETRRGSPPNPCPTPGHTCGVFW